MFRDTLETMTSEEIKQRKDAIGRLPHLLFVPQELRSDKSIVEIVKRYNELRMKENPLDLEEMRYLSNKFNYAIFMKQKREMSENLITEDFVAKIEGASKYEDEPETLEVTVETTKLPPNRMTIVSDDDLVESFLDDYIREVYGMENPATKEEEIPLADETDRSNLAEINQLDEEMLNLDKFIESMNLGTRGR